MNRKDLTFRVFVSSTFGDLVVERNALQERVFPALRKFCRERGARFQAIDLRWGVSGEAALDQQTMNICFEELARCQEMSPRPNFIILLGERYGWRPLPSRIPADEFEAILDKVPEAEKPLLCTGTAVAAYAHGSLAQRVGWYRKDLNAAPPEYVLQARTLATLPGAADDERRRAAEAEESDWYGIEARMRQSILNAIDSLRWGPDDPRRAAYEHSATHQEIEHGALDPRVDAASQVFAYFRSITGAPADGAAMPREHPKRRTLEPIEEAIRRDIQFIDRHPTTLFQCMWGLCWWYDRYNQGVWR